MGGQFRHVEGWDDMLVNIDTMRSVHDLSPDHLRFGRQCEGRMARLPHPGSERVGGHLRARRDPLPFAELIGVGQRSVTKTVAEMPTPPIGP